jgi:hypothetical protein
MSVDTYINILDGPCTDQITDPLIKYPFELDDFQKHAHYRILKEENVLITAHTGSGKTLIAELAIANCVKQTTEEFIRRAKEKHGAKCTYQRAEYKNSRTKVTITCRDHGDYLQGPYRHLIGKTHGCNKCLNTKTYTTDEWIRRAKEKHGAKCTYQKVKYKNRITKVMITCKTHGDFLTDPYTHLTSKTHGCKKCSEKHKFTTDEWIKKAQEVHKDRYDYSEVKYNGASKKVTIICSVHKNFEQYASNHLNGSNCPKCSGSHAYTTDEWIKMAKEVHGDKYNYSKVKYINSKTKVIIICQKHREYTQRPGYHLEGYGCNKCSGKPRYTTEDWIKKAKEVHGDKYDYSKVIYDKSDKKVTIVCFEHGNYEQKPKCHLSGQGCSRCAGTHKYTTEEWIKKAKEVHGDKYDYSKVKYINSATKITIICLKHKQFIQVPNHHLSGKGCIKCAKRYSYTTEEWIEFAKSMVDIEYDYSKVKYINRKTKITVICPRHKSFKIYTSEFMRIGGCSQCTSCTCCSLFKSLDDKCNYCKSGSPLYYKTKEWAVVEYLRKELPDNMFIHNKSVGRECTDGHLFPDIRYDCGHYQLIIEIDEFQHTSSSYSCDEARMYDIIAKLGQPCIFIRYNPDGKNSSNKELLKMVKKYLDIKEGVWDDHGLKTEYMFYSKP